MKADYLSAILAESPSCLNPLTVAAVILSAPHKPAFQSHWPHSVPQTPLCSSLPLDLSWDVFLYTFPTSQHALVILQSSPPWSSPLRSLLGPLLRVCCTAKRSNRSILKEISPEYSLEGLMLKLKLQYFGHLMLRTDSLEKTLMLGKTEGRRRRG